MARTAQSPAFQERNSFLRATGWMLEVWGALRPSLLLVPPGH